MKRKWALVAVATALAAALFLTDFSLLSPRKKNCWVDGDTGRSYYDASGNLSTGWREIDGIRYHFDESGILSSGWQVVNGESYYFQGGIAATGWVQRDASPCYLGADGTPATGWLTEGDATYYLDENGCPVTGQVALAEGEFRFREDGSLVTGWFDTGDATLYYTPEGTLVTGWTEIDGATYRFREDGSLVTGWYEEGEYRYYFNADGTPAQGEQIIDGQTWHFTPEGIQIYLVNPWHELPEDYTVELTATSGGYQIAQSCAQALEQMMADCYAAGLYPKLCSGYRTYWDQYAMFQDKIREVGSIATAKTIVAVPNTSEHQLGLAVDIISTTNQTLNKTQADTAVQKWLMAHCWDYGFILRYPEGSSEITGIIYEPWHYRYVGIHVAKIMQENGLTLEQYLCASRTEE